MRDTGFEDVSCGKTTKKIGIKRSYASFIGLTNTESSMLSIKDVTTIRDV